MKSEEALQSAQELIDEWAYGTDILDHVPKDMLEDLKIRIADKLIYVAPR